MERPATLTQEWWDLMESLGEGFVTVLDIPDGEEKEAALVQAKARCVEAGLSPIETEDLYRSAIDRHDLRRNGPNPNIVRIMMEESAAEGEVEALVAVTALRMSGASAAEIIDRLGGRHNVELLLGSDYLRKLEEGE